MFSSAASASDDPDDEHSMEPLAPDQLEPVLRVIEAAQSLASGDDVP